MALIFTALDNCFPESLCSFKNLPQTAWYLQDLCELQARSFGALAFARNKRQT
jgi:hypothetical protein